jgi:predicted ester cyclase
VAATLDTYTEDVIWDDVADAANPACPVQGKAATAGMYEGILAAFPDLHFESVVRFGDAEHVVDEAIVTGHAAGFLPRRRGDGASVRFRMLHVFDLRDGLIAREQAWFDTADVLREIEEHRRASADPGLAP